MNELTFLYGPGEGKRLYRVIQWMMRRYGAGNEAIPVTDPPCTEKDAFLIIYGDQVSAPGEVPLATLKAFLDERVRGIFSGVHILPFFPYSSDDGFSVMDYRMVDPALGSMGDIVRIARSYTLMADLVLNHCSKRHPWFLGFLEGRRRYRDFFIAEDGSGDWSRVLRPRTSPLFSAFEAKQGPVSVWTTFSEDQVDLNYKNPRVLLEMARILLFYAARGVRVFRLDAVAYLWKESGTRCVHLPQVHAVVRFFRALLDACFPGTVIITETNVPHRENLSYLGSGDDEAHMVYQFALPPLVLDAFLREDCGKLSSWLSELPALKPSCAYFNFLASHDGIGILPVRDILSKEERDGLVRSVKERGGRVSERTSGGGREPYELNITYLDAIAEKSLSPDARAKKFLASQAVLLSLPGVPGIYAHSLFGSENWEEGVSAGANRTINREKLSREGLISELDDESSLRHTVFNGLLKMLRVRSGMKAMHPASAAQVIPCEGTGSVLAVLRSFGEDSVLFLLNASSRDVVASFPASELPVRAPLKDALGGLSLGEEDGDRVVFKLEPWTFHWFPMNKGEKSEDA